MAVTRHSKGGEVQNQGGKLLYLKGAIVIVTSDFWNSDVSAPDSLQGPSNFKATRV
jgi:hypothetical protein